MAPGELLDDGSYMLSHGEDEVGKWRALFARPCTYLPIFELAGLRTEAHGSGNT